MSWIKCSERMPEARQVVLVWTHGWPEAETGYWDGDDVWWFGDWGHFRCNKITHWQPLPEPPNE